MEHAWAIPYVEAYDGRRRLVTVDVIVDAERSRSTSVVVAIDGRAFRSPHGRSLFEIPAERPVHCSVHLQHVDGSTLRGNSEVEQVAIAIIPPSPDAMHLVYRGRDEVSITRLG
ncbi:hypothetical protein GCM10009846_02660 [Agrococcus versicolor]|uniref:Uncharacterized protein n=1 Tax=Agrococcus versicolor TaxID=501482 RepID=A0ABN3AKD7_9MICO